MRPAPAALARIAVALAFAGALLVLWWTTPLSEWADPGQLSQVVGRLEPGWRPIAVVIAYVLGGLLFVPLTVLVLGTVWLFEPWQAMAYALLGAVGNACAGYATGRWLGPRLHHHVPEHKWRRLAARLRRPGVIAMTLLRLVPVAPFSLVNMAAGASGVPLRQYVPGTVLGLAPGIVVLAFVGKTLQQTLDDPRAEMVGAAIGAVAGLVLLVVATRRITLRIYGRRQTSRDR